MSAVQERPRHRHFWLILLGLGLVTLALYLPAIRHDFLEYDDQQYVTENLHVRSGLTLGGLGWAFGYHASNWHPLTWISHMLDCQFFTLKPAGHHFTSVLLHVANSLLLFVVVHRMTGARWRSACVAALFAWHPLHVESVAWIAERKDVLSAFFWMLTLWIYAGYARPRTRDLKLQDPSSKLQGNTKQQACLGETPNIKHQAPEKHQAPIPKKPALGFGAFWPRITPHASLHYILALSFFALGLMSKPMVVTLPFVFLLLDWWPLGGNAECGNAESGNAGPEPRARGWAALVFEKLPFFALSAVVCVLTVAAQRRGFSVVSTAGLPLAERVSHALVAYTHYLGATILPRHLAVYYPYVTEVATVKVVLAGVSLAGLTAICIGLRKRCPYLLVGWLWFLGTLVPVIGLVQVGDQAWADRYTYLPLIGIFLAVVWGFADLVARCQERSESQQPPDALSVRPAAFSPGLCAAASVVGFLLLAATWRQIGYWQNTRTLFEHAAAVTRNNHMAVTLLGSLLAKEGRLDQAMEHYQQALGWKPGYPEAHFFVANALDQQGKLSEAIPEYQKALRSKPMQEQTHLLLAAALAKQGRNDEAEAHYALALRLNPESATAHHNLARLLQTRGQLDEAREHYIAALKLDPMLAQAHNNLGILFLQQGRPAEGAAELREALRLKPGDRESEYNLALALSRQGSWTEAEGLFSRTVDPQSTDPNGHYQFAVVLAHLGKTREAMSRYASALLLRPDFPDALDALAWILATSATPGFRNGTEAVRMAERACELDAGKDARKSRTLAAAYAEAGRFPEAMAAAQRASQTATVAGQPELAKECLSMAQSFGAGKPWRSPAEGQ